IARADGTTAFKRLRFAFTRVASFASPFPILGVVSDVTEEYELQKRLAAEEKEHRREMEGLFQVVHVDPIMMREFIADTESELESINELMRIEGASGKEVLETLFQSAHAIKGNAALLGLAEFSAKVHQFEDKVKEKLEMGHEWRDLLQLTLGLAEIARELESLKALIEKVLNFQTDTKSAGLADSSLLRYSIEKLIHRESSRTSIPAGVDFEGFGRRTVPDEYRKLVKDILIQFIRNSFAHGFEPSAERLAAGKSAEGRISLVMQWGPDSLTIKYMDDGQGLNARAIREKAKTIPEFAENADSLDANALAKLIFRPGFSTASGTDLSAGRGVGMALVRRRVSEAGGKLTVKSSPGKYLEFAITLPMPLSAQAVS
ncbi:MAG: ATP-binding protein, partial [Treponemataceae bacterium]